MCCVDLLYMKPRLIYSALLACTAASGEVAGCAFDTNTANGLTSTDAEPGAVDAADGDSQGGASDADINPTPDAAVGARFWPHDEDQEVALQIPKAVAKSVGPELGGGAATAAKSPAQLAKPEDEARYQRCLDAVEASDTTTLNENASRVILDLSKQSRFEEILTLYQKIAGVTDTLPYTDGAFSEIASAADRGAPANVYVTIATQLIAEHPGSRFLPAILWRVAELQRQGGREALSVATLERLAQEHSDHYFGVKASESLSTK